MELISHKATDLLYTLADAAASAPVPAENKNGGFFGPLASLFETVLKVVLLRAIELHSVA